MSHTPGPWRAEGDNVFSGNTCQATHVANTNPVSDHFRSTAEANARLIARAPDLLAENERLREALRDFLENPLFHVAVGGNPNAVNAMLERARTVLSEQEGK